MGRKKLKPDYDPQRIMQELIDITKELYDRKLSCRQISKKLDLSVSKVIKFLVTGKFFLPISAGRLTNYMLPVSLFQRYRKA